MGIIGGYFGYLILKTIAPRGFALLHEECNHPTSKLTNFFGNDFYEVIKGNTVIDFGCGVGNQAVEMAVMGASKVIGIDILEDMLVKGRELAQRLSVADRCTFARSANELADIIISKDAFEHFSDPLAVLKTMSALLKKDGYVLATFGPTWKHPYGGHLFSVFPWAHFVFTEKALIRWRSDFKSDGATKFSEVEEGLNQLTIKRFEQIVEKSPLQLEWLAPVPIKGINFLKHRAFREIGTSVVRCKLILRNTKT